MSERDKLRGYTDEQRTRAELEPHMQADCEWLRVVTGKYDRWRSCNSMKTSKNTR